MSQAPSDGAQQTARRAGRGVVSISAAKLYFIFAGYAVQIMLPRLLGSPEAFGLYSSAMSLVSILNNLLIVATIQTVSKRVSESPADAPHALRQGLKLQLATAVVLGSALYSLAPTLADALLDPLLAPLFRVAAVVVACYALYAALVGSLNGRQLFQRQAALDMTYTTLRTVGLLGAAGLGFGAVGAMTGFAGAAFLVLTAAIFAVGLGAPGKQTPWRDWVAFMAPLWLYQLFLNLALQVDLTFLKRSVAELSVAGGMTAALAAETASRYAGFYRAAQTFSFVPYQLILSVTFVIFPMVSQAVSLGDLASTRSYIRNALRFSLIVLLAIAAPISGAADGVMHIAYPDAYLSGSAALATLSLGMVCFAMFVIAATILSGAGQPGLCAAIAAVTVAIVVGCNIGFVRAVGVGEHTLWAAAAGTSVGTTFALLAVGIALKLRFGAFIPIPSALRIGISAAVAFGVAHTVPHPNALGSLLALIAGGTAYLATLVLVGELGASERAALLRIVRRGKKT
jgi:stage V sporulation protein B